MKFYLSLMAGLAIFQMALAGRFNITCYYDTFSIQRGGSANFTVNDLKESLNYCTHLVYGYVGLQPDTYAIETLHSQQHLQFAQVKKLKKKYRNIKFLVSLGGGKDLTHPQKYIKLLEASQKKQEKFITSAIKLLHKYKFDGLDLAYQFPHNKSHTSAVEKIFNKGQQLLSKKNNQSSGNVHKQQFTVLVNELSNAFRREGLMLTLTVLPHVNTSSFINIPDVMNDFDFVTLATFDYSTPQDTPNEADYLAPLSSPSRLGKKQPSNIEQDVRQWLSKHIYSKKLNIGIATYGRTWRMTKKLKSTVMPIQSSLGGPAAGGNLTHTPGLLSSAEICVKLRKMTKSHNRIYGNYAYRSADVKGKDGLFITYEDFASLVEKGEFIKRNLLGGAAIFDLTLDDFRDKCKEGTFPTLKAIYFHLM